MAFDKDLIPGGEENAKVVVFAFDQWIHIAYVQDVEDGRETKVQVIHGNSEPHMSMYPSNIFLEKSAAIEEEM